MLRRPFRVEDRDLAGFRLRGNEVSRLESFSDAVFGFALTLLVVSLDVPKNFNDLAATMRGFPSFAICFLFLALIWNVHYKFCRRYGLDDGMTRFLTCVMLFLVLFFVYPLKFLFNVGITFTVFGPAPETPHLTGSQLSDLMAIYGLGFAAVYFSLFLLYLHAYRHRQELELNELEKFDTRYQIYRLSILIAVGLLAAALARISAIVAWSSLIYFILFPILRIYRIVHRKSRKPLLEKPESV
jgi:uncharacterized membrane protein